MIQDRRKAALFNCHRAVALQHTLGPVETTLTAALIAQDHEEIAEIVAFLHQYSHVPSVLARQLYLPLGHDRNASAHALASLVLQAVDPRGCDEPYGEVVRARLRRYEKRERLRNAAR